MFHSIVIRQATERRYQPTVDVFLPVCNEPTELLANSWNFVQKLDYPYLIVHVLDDGANDWVRDLAAAYGFHCEQNTVPVSARGVQAGGALMGTGVIFRPPPRGQQLYAEPSHWLHLCAPAGAQACAPDVDNKWVLVA